MSEPDLRQSETFSEVTASQNCSVTSRSDDIQPSQLVSCAANGVKNNDNMVARIAVIRVMALPSLGCESWKDDNDKSQRVKTGVIRGKQTKVNHDRGCKHVNQSKEIHLRVIWRVPPEDCKNFTAHQSGLQRLLTSKILTTDDAELWSRIMLNLVTS